MDLPGYVQIEPVGQCNLRCRMCPIAFREDGPPDGSPAFMPFETFIRLIDQFPTAQALHLQGLGEPMLHPRFFEMVTYAAGKGLQVSTNSNLTLLTAGQTERCVTSGLDWLHVSIDGATAETYERIRRRARFDRVVGNLERLLATRRRLRSARPRIRLVMVVMRQNLHELPALVRLAGQWAVEAMFVQPLCHDFGESSLPAEYQPMQAFVQAEALLAEDPVRVERYFREAQEVAQAQGVTLRLPPVRLKVHPPGTPGRARCNWPWTGAYISYQGSAMPCCMVATPDRAQFGNMGEQGVEAVWNGMAYQAFRDRLSSEEPPEICRSCAVYHGVF